MAQTIKAHQYKDFTILQTQQNLDVNGAIVPSGYVNLSQMCLVKNKQLKNYFANKETLLFFRDFVEAEILEQDDSRILLPENHSTFTNSKLFGLASGLLIETSDDIGGFGAVYGHLEIAIDVAQWVDSKFRVWANKNLRLLLNQEFIPVTEAARLAEAKLQEFKDTLFGGGNISNAEYVELCKECRNDNRGLNWG